MAEVDYAQAVQRLMDLMRQQQTEDEQVRQTQGIQALDQQMQTRQSFQSGDYAPSPNGGGYTYMPWDPRRYGEGSRSPSGMSQGLQYILGGPNGQR